MVQGVERNRLAHILADGTLDNSWYPGVADGIVNGLAVGGGSVYISGDFWEIGGVERNRVASIEEATGAVIPWDAQMSEWWWGYGSYFVRVYDLELNRGVVYLGGDVTTMGGELQVYFDQFGSRAGIVPLIPLLLED